MSVRQGITYQVFVQSFADSNGDGIGDIPGLISKLDYLVDLGIETLWLMPIHPSPSYHKYDVTDYYSIHSDYGTLADFQKLLKEAQIRNLKVIIDLVINHCSVEHPWFLKAQKGDPKYRNYFIWKSKAEIDANNDWQKEKSADSDNLNLWNEVSDSKELYYAYFWQGMPDLNFDHPPVRQEVYQIAKFWLEMGVDGFRLDAALHIYPENRIDDSAALWEEFKGNLELIKPDIILLGEVWSDEHTQVRFAKGFTSLFNFELSYSILDTVKRGSTSSKQREAPVQLFEKCEKLFRKKNRHFSQSTFLSNHDQVRVRSFLNRHAGKTKLAATILFTLPGNPIIYYGEELGMEGRKPDEHIREPFVWSDIAQENTSWIESRHFKTANTLERQAERTSSIYQHYQNLIHLKKQNELLTEGSIKTVNLNDHQLLAFTRFSDQLEWLIIHNLASSSKSIQLLATFTSVYHSNPHTRLSQNKCLLPAYGSIILSKMA